MQKALFLAVAAVGLVGWLCWWRVPKAESPQQVQDRLFLETTGSGHSGLLKSDRWDAYAPYYREGALLVHAGLAGPGGKGRRPVFLLLYRLAARVPFAATGGLQQAGEQMAIFANQYAADGNFFPFRWTATEKAPGDLKTPSAAAFADTFRVGTTPRLPTDGRIFLIDLTEEPPAVAQQEADLEELFRGVGETVTVEEMKGMVERLSEWEPAVKEFLDRIPKKP